MADPWLMSGIILIGITASLALLFFFFRPAIQSFSPREARELLTDDVIQQVIDVRRPEEFYQGHYRKAINVPLKELVTQLPKRYGRHDHAIFLYGDIQGRQAARAAVTAQELGYSNVRYLRYGDYADMEPRPRILSE
jgi:rhodanese-related sulfurtransferase